MSRQQTGELLKSVLTCTTIKYQKYLMWSFRNNLLHDIFNFLQLVHQANLIMQTTSCINNNYVSTICLALCNVSKATLAGSAPSAASPLERQHGHPYLNLFNSSSTEGICCTKIDFLPSLLKLPSKLTYRCGLTNTIYSYNKYYVWVCPFW